jgi:hypothetical protein
MANQLAMDKVEAIKSLEAAGLSERQIADQLDGGPGNDWYFAKLAASHADHVTGITPIEKLKEIGIP